jgi:hypothetical protein
MKTINEITRKFRGSGLAVASIFFATLSLLAPANAQYRPTGPDGITASPKLRSQLDERRARSTPATPAAREIMDCPKCKDVWVSQVDREPKGSSVRVLTGKTTKLVAKHLCEGCGVDWSIAGTGKAKHLVATHECSGCGSPDTACCSPRGSNNVATKGMGETFNIAPLK